MLIIMPQCPHNQQIRYFCLRPQCPAPNSGACLRCLHEQHQLPRELSPASSPQIVDVEELQRLLNRYSFANKIKPQCVVVQESFYAYFKKLQMELKEIIYGIDEICKNVVNTIGFPFICYNNFFTIYKRIKNKDYTRLPSQELARFVTEFRTISTQRLTEMEERLYLKQVNNSHEMVKEIEHMVASFENVMKGYEQKSKFVHDAGEFVRNREIVERIRGMIKAGAEAKNEGKNQGKNSGRNQVRDSEIRKRVNSLNEGNLISKMAKSAINQTEEQQPKQGSLRKTIIPRLSQNVSLKAPQPALQKIVSPRADKKPKQDLREVVEQSAIRSGWKQYAREAAKNETLEAEKMKQSLKLKTSVADFINQSRQGASRQSNNRRDGKSLSIDTHMVKKSKLSEKVSQLKQQPIRSQQQGAIKTTIIGTQQQAESDSDRQKSKQIQNNNLPEAPAEEENLKTTENQLEILPVHRKLEKKIYDIIDEVQQLESPLLKNKFKAESMSRSRKSGGRGEAEHEGNFQKDKNRQKQREKEKERSLSNALTRVNQTATKNAKKTERQAPRANQALPQLNEVQEKSFVLLIASLKLQTNQAIPLLQKSLQQCNKNLSAAEYLSYLYLESNQFQKCIKICNKYLGMIWHSRELLQSRNLLFNNKCSAFNQLGRFSQAIKMCEDYPDPNENTYKNLANAYYALGMYPQAIEYYNRIFENNDDETYHNLSACYYMSNDLVNAKVAVEFALELEPKRKQYLELLFHINKSLQSRENQRP